jgi:CNT family concentrative nucleoside transporter
MTGTIGTIAFGLFGLATLLTVAFSFSNNRKEVDWRLVASGIGLQLIFAILVILVPGGRQFFEGLSRIFVTIISFAMDGSAFVF